MMTGRWLATAGVLWLAVCAAGCDDETTKAPCVDGDPMCGKACDADRPCPTGLFCAAGGKCGKQCRNDTTAYACANLGVCTQDGRCPSTGTGVTDAGNDLGDINFDASNICADQNLNTRMVTPNVLLIVDQSGSMDDEFDNGTRWNVLRDFLLQSPGGLIADLQDQVRFGLALYSARNQGDSGGDVNDPLGECPLVEIVPPALQNFQNISDTYGNADPISDTPTGDSIDKIIDDLGLDAVRPDMQDDPYVFILATDGNPDRCERLQGHDMVSQDETIAAVTRAYDLGVRTFIISVGDEVSDDHQQAVANAGLGRDESNPAEYWEAGDDATLRQAITDIVRGQLNCEVALNGEVVGNPCDGTVRLNDEALTCGGDDGWELIDPTHIQLKGAACEALKNDSSARLDVTFPCSVDIVF